MLRPSRNNTAVSNSGTTVKTHMSATLVKLGANDRAHAVALAVQRGYIDLRPTVR
jgi:DNA-binding NarL/FixJ family response regulator